MARCFNILHFYFFHSEASSLEFDQKKISSNRAFMFFKTEVSIYFSRCFINIHAYMYTYTCMHHSLLSRLPFPTTSELWAKYHLTFTMVINFNLHSFIQRILLWVITARYMKIDKQTVLLPSCNLTLEFTFRTYIFLLIVHCDLKKKKKKKEEGMENKCKTMFIVFLLGKKTKKL